MDPKCTNGGSWAQSFKNYWRGALPQKNLTPPQVERLSDYPAENVFIFYQLTTLTTVTYQAEFF